LREALFSHKIPKVLPDPTQSTAIASDLSRSPFARNLRKALADLHDAVALRRNPLIQNVVLKDKADRAAALREWLVNGVSALQPGPDAHVDSRAWRPYRVLQLRYVEARSAVEVERLLAISTSQYYREHQAALDALTVLLFEQALQPQGGVAASDVEDLVASPAQHHNLPTYITSFIGRERELPQISALLTTNRLVTLTGAGGCGKTRLALEVAAGQVQHFSDGVWLVDLTPLAEASLVAQTIAFALGVQEGPAEPITATLVRAIQSKNMLLVLDNCEHLLQACSHVVDALLRASARLKVLTTTREIIGLTGECIFHVPPLSLPSSTLATPTDALLEFPAVRLFVERASSVSTSFALTEHNAASVVQICSQLDGLPLAIELAAARVNVFTSQQIAQRLTDRFQLLSGGSRAAPPHHQTLRALIDWSYELLSPDERRLFERLAVFAGGWTIEAAEIVCAVDELEPAAISGLLAALVERSLVVAEPVGDEMRYHMLETLRMYAQDQLAAAGDALALGEQHAGYYANLAGTLDNAIFGPRQLEALQNLELEHNNFRTVLGNASQSARSAGHAARVAASLGLFWFLRNYFTEAHHWCDWVLSLAGVSDDAAISRCMGTNGFMSASLGEHVAGLNMCDASLELAQRSERPDALAWAHSLRCGTYFVTGDALGTEREARIAIQACSEADWAWGAAVCSAWLGRSWLMQRQVAEAVAHLRETLHQSRTIGDPFSTALALSFYGVAVGADGEYDTAAACLAQALDLFSTIGCFAQISRCLVDWSMLALRSGSLADAATALADGLELANRLGRVPYRAAQLLAGTAQLSAAKNRWTDAARLLALARAVRFQSGAQLPPERAQEETALQQMLEQQLPEADLADILSGAQHMDETAALSLAREVLVEIRGDTARVTDRDNEYHRRYHG
jgi:non-specific serine/threonine protein kinase